MIREICGQHEVTIMKGHVSKDHVHLFVSIPPQVTISRFLQRLKGKTAFKLLHEFPHLRKKFWGGLCQEDAKASCCTKDEGRSFGVAL